MFVSVTVKVGIEGVAFELVGDGVVEGVVSVGGRVGVGVGVGGGFGSMMNCVVTEVNPVLEAVMTGVPKIESE